MSEPRVVRLLSDDQIEELRTFQAPYVDSHLNEGSSEKSYLDKFNSKAQEGYTNRAWGGKRVARKGKNKVVLHEWFDDINQVFEEELGSPVIDCNYLRYDVGDFLVPHRDTYDGFIRGMDGSVYDRKFAIITMVDKSDDLEGGILVIRSEDESKNTYHSLEIGETIIFPATLLHECTEITKGFREVYVCWV